MSSILRIQFPTDFEDRYNAYKAKLLGPRAIAPRSPSKAMPPVTSAPTLQTKQSDKITICFELDYGFYREGKRDKGYLITSDGNGKKSFKMILTLNDRGKLRASELAREIGCDMKKISDMRTRINNQIYKHCRVIGVITFKDHLYGINDKFVIKAA